MFSLLKILEKRFDNASDHFCPLKKDVRPFPFIECHSFSVKSSLSIIPLPFLSENIELLFSTFC